MNDEPHNDDGYIQLGTPLSRDFFALLGIKSARRKRREREQEE
jgi:hypothetical protein